MDILLARPQRALVLLSAVEHRVIQPTALGTTQIKFLKTHPNKEVRASAAKILAANTPGKRQDVIDSYMPALSLKGNAAHGRKIYEERCSICHRLGGEGHAVGPDLVTVKTTGKEKIMVNIIDPNREVAPQYQAFEIELKDGDSLIGIIANENGNSVTLRRPLGVEDVILRSKIQRIKNQNLSLMPEGIEAGLKHQDVADLLEFITTADAGH